MSDAPRRLPPKKEVALALLQGPSLFIHLDPRKSGVLVPKWLMGQPQLVLQVGLNMTIQIPDLTVDEDGVCCTLSFSRTPFWCQLPWSAVYALVGEDGRGMIWPNDVPPEVALQMQKGAPAAPAPIAPTKTATGRKAKTKLAAVSDAEAPKQTRTRTRAEPKPEEPAGPKLIEPERERSRPRRIPVPVVASTEAEERRDEASETPDEKPTTTTPSPENGSSRKPKRELPPYLRIVK